MKSSIERHCQCHNGISDKIDGISLNLTIILLEGLPINLFGMKLAKTAFTSKLSSNMLLDLIGINSSTYPW